MLLTDNCIIKRTSFLNQEVKSYHSDLFLLMLAKVQSIDGLLKIEFLIDKYLTNKKETNEI